MEREKVIQEIENTIKRCGDGTWSLPMAIKTLLIALLYLIEDKDVV